MSIKFDYFTCACLSPDHTLRVSQDDSQVDIEIFIEQRPFLARLKTCFNYLFKQKSGTEFTTCVCTLNKEDVQRLADYLDNAVLRDKT
jgi:hypothetical protein